MAKLSKLSSWICSKDSKDTKSKLDSGLTSLALTLDLDVAKLSQDPQALGQAIEWLEITRDELILQLKLDGFLPKTYF